MNNLECRKQGFNKLVCKRTGKEIKLSECSNCPYKEYKNNVEKNKKNVNFIKKTSFQEKKSPETGKIKKKTTKLTKLERERFSLFTNDDTKCMLCGSRYQLTWNEIFRGKNRQLSMKYGLCQRLCLPCHMKYQDDPIFNEKWHKKGQLAFNTNYPELDFVKIFGINYLR